MQAILRIDARRGDGRRPKYLVLSSRDDQQRWTYRVPQPDAWGMSDVEVDVANLVRAGFVDGTLDFYLDWRTGKKKSPRLQRMGRFADTQRTIHPQRRVVDGTPVELTVTSPGNLSLTFGFKTQPAPKVEFTSAEWSDESADFTCEVVTNNRPIRSACLVVTEPTTESRHVFPAVCQHTPEHTRANYGRLCYRMHLSIDFRAIARLLSETEKAIRIAIELDTDECGSVRAGLRLPQNLSERTIGSTAIPISGHILLFVPRITNGILKYKVERFAEPDFVHLRRLLKLSWLFPLIRPFTRIWLIGEVPYKAQDNGYQFFRYVRTNYPGKRAYYVIDPDSPDREKVAQLGHVLDRYSRRHILYSLLASRLIGTHHTEYLFASEDPRVAKKTRGVRFHLKHGIMAGKNVMHHYARQGIRYALPDRWGVASELERRIIMEDHGYPARQVKVTGLARFDTLFAGDTKPDRRILVMPTWRASLSTDSIFQDSEFLTRWRDLLCNERLRELATKHGLTITVALHSNMRMFADYFELPHVQLVRQSEIDVQQLLLSSAVMITDFSSVGWDFSFLDRPVLYFQWNRYGNINGRPPHIDYYTQLPGPVSSTPEQLLGELSRTAASGFTMEPKYRERAHAFLDHRDQENCDRIYSAVRRAWTPTTIFDRIRNSRLVQDKWWQFRNGSSYPIWMRRLYQVGCILPRRNSIVFECNEGLSYGDAPKYLYERLTARSHLLKVVWVNDSTLRLTDPSTVKIPRHSPRYYWELSRARYWVNNRNFPQDLVKPRRTRLLQTWHEAPAKWVRGDAGGESCEADSESTAQRACDADLLVSAGPHNTSLLRQAPNFTGEVCEVGNPRTDPFFWSDADQRRELARARLGMGGDDRKVILYLPACRDDQGKDIASKQKGGIDVDWLSRELADEYVLVARIDPLARQTASRRKVSRPDFLIDGSRYPDITELLLASDVLVTDYSALVFDYAVLNRPILFFIYDLERYRDVLRGCHLNFERDAPGPLLRDNAALISALKSLDAVHADYAGRLAEFVRTFSGRDDGGAADRVLDIFFRNTTDRFRRISSDP
jgi:CDP-glycerol glycerophosphotransferase